LGTYIHTIYALKDSCGSCYGRFWIEKYLLSFKLFQKGTAKLGINSFFNDHSSENMVKRFIRFYKINYSESAKQILGFGSNETWAKYEKSTFTQTIKLPESMYEAFACCCTSLTLLLSVDVDLHPRYLFHCSSWT